jgi:hypothetical protein
MPSLANPNGTCPRNYNYSALFLDVTIQRTSNSMPGLDHPDTETIIAKAADFYWKENSVQLGCTLDCSLPLPACMEDDIWQYVEAATTPAMAQSPLSIASSSDTTVVMPSDDKGSPLDVDSATVLMPTWILPLKTTLICR